jgi:hypothetical protein
MAERKWRTPSPASEKTTHTRPARTPALPKKELAMGERKREPSPASEKTTHTWPARTPALPKKDQAMGERAWEGRRPRRPLCGWIFVMS